MPLTKEGKETLEAFQKTYGKVRGKKYFYAEMVKYPKKTASWHRGRGTGKIQKAQRTYKRSKK